MSDMAQLVAAMGSAIAAVGAWASILFNQKNEKKRRSPIIRPKILKKEIKISNFYDDWETGEELDIKLSETVFPVTNYGGTASYNIQYSFSLKNEGFYENVGNIGEGSFVGNNEGRINFEDLPPHRFMDIVVTTGDDYFIRRYRSTPILNNLSEINPSETEFIRLPSYFIALMNYSFVNSTPSDLTNKETYFPELFLKVYYNDLDNVRHVCKYVIEIGRYKYNEDNINFDLVYKSIINDEKLKMKYKGDEIYYKRKCYNIILERFNLKSKI